MLLITKANRADNTRRQNFISSSEPLEPLPTEPFGRAAISRRAQRHAVARRQMLPVCATIVSAGLENNILFPRAIGAEKKACAPASVPQRSHRSKTRRA